MGLLHEGELAYRRARWQTPEACLKSAQLPADTRKVIKVKEKGLRFLFNMDILYGIIVKSLLVYALYLQMNNTYYCVSIVYQIQSENITPLPYIFEKTPAFLSNAVDGSFSINV